MKVTRDFEHDFGLPRTLLSESMSEEDINELKLNTQQHGHQLIIDAGYAMLELLNIGHRTVSKCSNKNNRTTAHLT